jgi:cysteine desulfurase
MPEPIYLDYNATAPVRPDAARAAADAMAEVGNASSVHRFGRDARRRVEHAREQVAELVGARPPQVVFTAGGTEANNLAVQAHAGRQVLVSAVEHDSVLRTLPDAEVVPVDGEGRVDPDALRDMLAAGPAPALVSVMLANNETGVIQPVSEIAALCREHGVRVHCDAVQAAGKIPVDVGALGVDLLTLSAHKLGGPQGAGALVVTDDRPVLPHMRGGGQERGYRAGTENVPAIAGFGVAAAMALAERDHMRALGDWRDRLEREARASASDLVVHGGGAPRLPNTTCLGLPGVAAETQLMKLDLAGIAVSSGSACSSGKVHDSHVLTAMGAAEPGTAIRVSMGWATRAAEIDRFLAVWSRLAAKRRPADAAAA